MRTEGIAHTIIRAYPIICPSLTCYDKDKSKIKIILIDSQATFFTSCLISYYTRSKSSPNNHFITIRPCTSIPQHHVMICYAFHSLFGPRLDNTEHTEITACKMFHTIDSSSITISSNNQIANIARISADEYVLCVG